MLYLEAKGSDNKGRHKLGSPYPGSFVVALDLGGGPAGQEMVKALCMSHIEVVTAGDRG